MASVVKDAADDPDCQGLREQWYYLRFYVRRTMPPTEETIDIDDSVGGHQRNQKLIRLAIKWNLGYTALEWFCNEMSIYVPLCPSICL